GRAKEIIIVRGVHYACHEIEQAVQAVPGVDATCVAAISAHVKKDGTEGLAVFFSPDDGPGFDRATTATSIKRRVAEGIGLAPRWVVAIEHAAFPKTTSGKIRRSEMRSDLEAGLYGGNVEPGDAGAVFGIEWSPKQPHARRPTSRVLLAGAALGTKSVRE